MAKKIITKRQEVILLLLYIFRFLNSKQLQEFLGHKDHRRINSWLKDLTTKGYIQRDFTPIYGVLTKPAVYNLSSLGRKYIKESFQYSFPTYLKRIARDKDTSKGFRIKCQLLADWYLMLFSPLKEKTEKDTSQGNKDYGDKLRQLAEGILPTILGTVVQKKEKNKMDIAIVDYLLMQLMQDSEKEEKLPMNTRQFFTPAYFPPFILLGKIKPDGYLRKRVRGGIMQGLLFIIDAYIPRFILRYTLKRIFDALDEEYWEDESIHSLHMYFLCPNNQIIIYMRKLLTQRMNSYYAKIPLNFHFATRNQLYNRKGGKTKEVGWRTVSSED